MSTPTSTPRRHGVDTYYSAAAIHNGIAYLAGIVAENGTTDIAGQTREVLATLDRTLTELGSDKSKLLSVTVWLSDIADYEGMNAEWMAWVDPQGPPPRATAVVGLADPQYLIEVITVAAV